MISPRAERVSDQWPVAWVLASSTAIVAAAFWQREPGWLPIVVAIAATAVAGLRLPTLRRPLLLPVLTVMFLVTTVAIAIAETITLSAVQRDWPTWSAGEREARAQRVAARVTEVADALRVAAEQAAADSALVRAAALGLPPATARVVAPAFGATESAMLVFHRGRLVARAGQAHTPVPATGPLGLRLVDGAFHTSLMARARSADSVTEVVTVALVASAPPADRFARSLLQSLADRADVSRTIVESPDSSRVVAQSTVVVVPDGPRRLARVRTLEYAAGETQLRLLERARTRSTVSLVLALLGLLITAWRRPARTGHRVLASGSALLALAVAPLTALSNVSPLFDPASFFAPMGGPLTSNLAALLLTATLSLAMLLLVLRSVRRRPPRVLAIVVVLLVAAGGPLLLRDLARGIALPAGGAGFPLWIAWQLALAVAGVSVLLLGAAAGHSALGPRRGLPPSLGPLLALIAAVLAPLTWDAPGGWPAWYPALWVGAIGTVAFTRRGLGQVIAAAVVAGSGAVTLTWGATVRERMALAQYDLARLSAIDENAYQLLGRFANSLAGLARPVQGNDDLLREYAASELALAGYPARLARWSRSDLTAPVSVLALVPVNDTIGAQSVIASMARESGTVEIRAVDDGPTTVLVAAVPTRDGLVTTIAIPPRTGLLPLDPFVALTGVTGARGIEPPYRVSLTAPSAADSLPQPLAWRRRGDAMYGEGVAGNRADVRRVRVEVALRGIDVLYPRGALLIFLDVLVVLAVWTATGLADGALGRLLRVRRVRWSRSYRVRLSAALLAFFMAPAGIFAAWAWYRLQTDDQAARELLVRETLRVAAAENALRALGSAPSSTGVPLFLYRSGLLETASDALLNALAPLGRLLPASLTTDDFQQDERFTTRRVMVGEARTVVGFRQLTDPGTSSVGVGAATVVLATPTRGEEFALDARREDLGILVLFVSMLGALAALWSSGVAARSLARPVGALREAALAIAADERPPALGTAPATEFAPVYRAFGRMAADLATSRAALETAQRRTAAVLQHVASGVLAMTTSGEVLIANPRASTMLGVELRTSGASLAQWPPSLAPVVARCLAFLDSLQDEEAFDLTVRDRQLRARLTRLPSGAVLTLDDVTDLASAQRVLAWGEMARQVAHEIKNPLTPIRLGVQHLRRAYRDGRGDFSQILDTNVTRVLQEIDHLDEIARSFSRYGTAPEDRPPAVAVDIAAVARDMVSLERLGEHDGRADGIAWRVTVADDSAIPALGLAQRDELKEVLLNVLENARLAQSTTVTVRVVPQTDLVMLEVTDNGGGIDPNVLSQVFEPHFSTRTSGSGLGLAISRRLIEGWGGTIRLDSQLGEGTTVRIALRRAAA